MPLGKWYVSIISGHVHTKVSSSVYTLLAECFAWLAPIFTEWIQQHHCCRSISRMQLTFNQRVPKSCWYSIDRLRRMKSLVDCEVTLRIWTWDRWFSNTVPNQIHKFSQVLVDYLKRLWLLMSHEKIIKTVYHNGFS